MRASSRLPIPIAIMEALVPINELAGIKANNRYQRVYLKPTTLNQADLSNLSDRVRLIFPISEMVCCELTRRGIMFTITAHVRVPVNQRNGSDSKVDDLFIFTFLRVVCSINPHALGFVDQPVPLIGDGYEGGRCLGSFRLVFIQPVTGPQALMAGRRVLEIGYEQTRGLLVRAGELSANRVLPDF